MARAKRTRFSYVLRTIFLPSIMLALLFTVSRDVYGQATNTSPERIGPSLSINIPTVTFQKIVRTTEAAAGAATTDVIDVPWISNYIAGVYRYSVSIASILAGVMFVIGGFQYLTAGGDASRVSKGRERITNAVIGLVLVLAAYVILLTINPDLVSLTSLRIRLVPRKAFETISASQIQQLTGHPVQAVGSGGGAAGTGGSPAGGSGMMGMAMDAARKTGIPELPCFVTASMQHESGGRQNALGHDENATSTQFRVGARTTFINSGRLYSGGSFTPVGCNDKSCQNQGPRNDDSFNASTPPEYGLDWRFSHGFGSGQSTLFTNSQPCPGNEAAGRGFRSGNKCYSIPQLLDAQTQVEAMVDHYKACWQRSGGDPARGYVCYAGTIAPDNPIILSRVAAYDRCRAAGG